jgi:hypothetical protein
VPGAAGGTPSAAIFKLNALLADTMVETVEKVEDCS